MNFRFLYILFVASLMNWNCQAPQSSESSEVKAEPTPAVFAEFIYEEAPFPSCHASTIVESDAGSILAAWFGGTDEKDPDVGIWFARKTESGWSAPVELANGVQSAELRYPTWNPVLFQPQSGPLHLYYKVGPTPMDWWGEVIRSDDDGETWSEPERLEEGFLGPVKDKAVEIAAGVIIAPSSTEHDGWKVHIERSADNGETWEWIGPIEDPEDFQAIQPSLLVHQDGKLQVLCRSKKGVIATSWSEDQGLTWSPLSKIDVPNPNSGLDAVTLQNGKHLMVYNPTSVFTGKWGGPRSPLSLGISDDGINWEKVMDLETEKDAEFSYPAIIQSSDGMVHITYTWKRERIKYAKVDPKDL